jgi:glycosyltransferase involved in cell wall biosynthesis
MSPGPSRHRKAAGRATKIVMNQEPIVSLPPLKVAYVIGELGVGGAERQLLKKMRLLKARGLDLVVISLSEGGTLAEDFRRGDFTIYQLPRSHSMELSRIRRLAAIFRRERPHVVHAEQYVAGWYARIAALLTGVPVRVQAIRSAYPRIRRRYRLSEAILTRFTDAYVVNAEAIKRRTVDVHGVAPSRVHVVLNVFDPADTATRSRDQVRAELNVGSNQLAVGIVASLEPEKNHPLFLRFARQLLDAGHDARFYVIGDGKGRHELESTIAREGLGDRVTLLGMRRDVPELLEALDVSVNCSTREGLCNALLESIAAGIPVLASEVGGTPEIIESGRHGELFPSDDLDGMVGAFERLTRDLPAYRARIAEDHVTFLDRFSGPRIAREMDAIYRDCVEARGIAVAPHEEPAHVSKNRVVGQ